MFLPNIVFHRDTNASFGLEWMSEDWSGTCKIVDTRGRTFWTLCQAYNGSDQVPERRKESLTPFNVWDRFMYKENTLRHYRDLNGGPEMKRRPCIFNTNRLLNDGPRLSDDDSSGDDDDPVGVNLLSITNLKDGTLSLRGVGVGAAATAGGRDAASDDEDDGIYGRNVRRWLQRAGRNTITDFLQFNPQRRKQSMRLPMSARTYRKDPIIVRILGDHFSGPLKWTSTIRARPPPKPRDHDSKTKGSSRSRRRHRKRRRPQKPQTTRKNLMGEVVKVLPKTFCVLQSSERTEKKVIGKWVELRPSADGPLARVWIPTHSLLQNVEYCRMVSGVTELDPPTDDIEMTAIAQFLHRTQRK